MLPGSFINEILFAESVMFAHWPGLLVRYGHVCFMQDFNIPFFVPFYIMKNQQDCQNVNRLPVRDSWGVAVSVSILRLLGVFLSYLGIYLK